MNGNEWGLPDSRAAWETSAPPISVSLFNFWYSGKFPELLPAETKREEPAQMCLLIYFNLVPVTILRTAVEGEEGGTLGLCLC